MTRLTRPLVSTIALSLAGVTTQAALADDATLDFGVPAWPGITVKTEIAEQLLNPLGYDTQTHEIGLQVIYQGMESGDVDAFLGAWLPAQKEMFEPRKASGVLTDVANNVDGAQMTLAVPTYLHERGIQSFADLDEHRDEFNSQIHGFGAGSAASEILHNAIDNDTWGLGDWSLVDTSEVGMLSAAQDAISREEAIVWVGWTPHWMNLELPMRYLEDPENLFGENNGESDVRTLLRSDYADAHPALVTFFEQFSFTADEQSWMIQAFGQEERDLAEVAQQWINDHPERVEAMLADVTTTEGDAAWPVIEARLQ
ncbi:MAG TPA: glycine/betaine ABC transporter [Halomonas sp.]|jgi:glycine betaine/proline transport system substrate-binding protein|uniref:Glycine/betaine ABC transporter substrate-binding protein n=1 Tax=Vreelandella aquamarina TaxID=77097 RepID=A0A6F8SX37_9GAMM|nr:MULTISPECIES: ABC transporter substrate-binding protein [Halomonas]KTG27601.1 glycine/betaine ABC transporter [Idiomarina sp. H105]MED5458736.1 ABC transporter substrate-binding protein [Pseudomonadota bacterium]OAF03798.1 glycine/betaine ABC transporter [Idiomarina sp. WRN-38]MCC4290567.1 ABC transporter substrate-binding protein [Halomonas axialensis]MCD1651995.1 ABC transporter substrate-binding protein [Halomonas axialensis]|tara:strand:- start:322 stop:1260 length:939 start_codon:yes stop_codon:yes gene_type:complete